MFEACQDDGRWSKATIDTRNNVVDVNTAKVKEIHDDGGYGTSNFRSILGFLYIWVAGLAGL